MDYYIERFTRLPLFVKLLLTLLAVVLLAVLVPFSLAMRRVIRLDRRIGIALLVCA